MFNYQRVTINFMVVGLYGCFLDTAQAAVPVVSWTHLDDGIRLIQRVGDASFAATDLANLYIGFLCLINWVNEVSPWYHFAGVSWDFASSKKEKRDR